MCTSPILALSVMKNDEDKHVLKFVPRGDIEKIEDLKRVYGCDEVFMLPCMKCKECRQKYADDWAVRCSLESYLHKYNYFITLTYDDFHLPFNVKTARSDFSNQFLKSLGNLLTGERNRPKFFACVEKGDMTGRIHLHGVLFLDHKLDLVDPVKKGDFFHFHSPQIKKCWSFGLHDVSEFDHDCAAYVGKYATKQGHCFMSRNLAKGYYEKFKNDIIKDDFKIYVDFNKKNFIEIPKCFARWYLEDDVVEINDFKLRQKDLQRLLCIAEIQKKYYSSESKLKASKILAFMKHDKYSRERSEF